MLWEAGLGRIENVEGVGHFGGLLGLSALAETFFSFFFSFFFLWVEGGGVQDLALGLVRLLAGFGFFCSIRFRLYACSIFELLWFLISVGFCLRLCVLAFGRLWFLGLRCHNSSIFVVIRG